MIKLEVIKQAFIYSIFPILVLGMIKIIGNLIYIDETRNQIFFLIYHILGQIFG